MTLWRCDGATGPGGGPCNTLYAVGLSRCPRCHSTEFHEEGSMPKITRGGGPSDATTVAEDAAVPVEGEAAGTVEQPETAGEEVPSSPGTSSSTSSEKEQTSPEPSEKPLPKRAPKTGSRSRKAQTESSTASSTATDGPKTGGADASGSS